VKHHGRAVVAAGTGINLALGVLYSWSVISKKIPAEWGWTEADKALPYSVACIVFALVMVVAGRMQDRIGPRWVATLGGILTGFGMILASRFQSVAGFVVGFGVMAGAGIGLGYASATPPAVKWFPRRMTGLIAGIVVSGFGLASVYIAPLATLLLNETGVPNTMWILGAAFLVAVTLCAQLLRNPPQGFKPEGAPAANPQAAPLPAPHAEVPPSEMLKTPQFYLLWLMYMFASGAGLMIIAKLAKICEIQASIKAGFLFVALLAVGNASGRIIAGFLSDKIGRTRTMLSVFLFQALLMFGLRFVDSWGVFIFISALIGFNYGANLSVFPSVTKDWFGLKNFGTNYGLVFTAWGVGGLIMPYISGKVFDSTGRFDQAFYIAGALLIVAAVLTFATRAPRSAHAEVAVEPSRSA